MPKRIHPGNIATHLNPVSQTPQVRHRRPSPASHRSRTPSHSTPEQPARRCQPTQATRPSQSRLAHPAHQTPRPIQGYPQAQPRQCSRPSQCSQPSRHSRRGRHPRPDSCLPPNSQSRVWPRSHPARRETNWWASPCGRGRCPSPRPAHWPCRPARLAPSRDQRRSRPRRRRQRHLHHRRRPPRQPPRPETPSRSQPQRPKSGASFTLRHWQRSTNRMGLASPGRKRARSPKHWPPRTDKAATPCLSLRRASFTKDGPRRLSTPSPFTYRCRHT